MMPKSIPLTFMCKKCRHEINLTLDKLEKLSKTDCPECGEELMDSNPNMTLTSYPAKKSIHCSKCTYQGYRIA